MGARRTRGRGKRRRRKEKQRRRKENQKRMMMLRSGPPIPMIALWSHPPSRAPPRALGTHGSTPPPAAHATLRSCSVRRRRRGRLPWRGSPPRAWWDRSRSWGKRRRAGAEATQPPGSPRVSVVGRRGHAPHAIPPVRSLIQLSLAGALRAHWRAAQGSGRAGPSRPRPVQQPGRNGGGRACWSLPTGLGWHHLGCRRACRWRRRCLPWGPRTGGAP